MNELLYKIEESISEHEEIESIIPISPKRLNLAFVPKVLKPTLWENFLIVLSTLALSFVPLTAVVYFLIKQSYSRYWLLPFAIFTVIGCYFFMKRMFENNVKKYPIPLIAVCSKQAYFFLFNSINAEQHLKYPLPFLKEHIKQSFWVNKNEKNGKIGPEFELKNNGELILSGQLEMTANAFYSDYFDDEFLMDIIDFKSRLNNK